MQWARWPHQQPREVSKLEPRPYAAVGEVGVERREEGLVLERDRNADGQLLANLAGPAHLAGDGNRLRRAGQILAGEDPADAARRGAIVLENQRSSSGKLFNAGPEKT